MSFMYQNDCSLLVSSCDRYSSAWYPYFELLKIYWKESPYNIYLNTESKNYQCDGLNITTLNCDKKVSWSERLYRALERINTKYVIFTLEDFFIVDYVKNEKIQEAYSFMEKNPNIAVCRLFASNDGKLQKTKEYGDFYNADKNTYLRLDTQVALWNRKTLMSFLDFSESPWDFENKGTERVKKSKKIFLWYYQENNYDTKNMIVPYFFNQQYGYGIAWDSHWLWKNKELFEKNNIKNVDYKSLGVLSEKSVKRRLKYLYNRNPRGIKCLVQKIYRFFDRINRTLRMIKFSGCKDGIKKLLNIIKK